MALYGSLSLLVSFVLILGANVGANKYLRRAAETKGVFPVLEAKEEYEVNKRSFEKRQSTGLVAPDCKPCPPFDPEAIEKGDTHCSPGLKPVKRCDAKCGCESWDCVRENCDVWIKANAKNFTGPCVNDATGEVDACLTRTKEEWNCGCKVMACEKNCDKTRGPLPKDFEGCNKNCSFQVFDKCSCALDKCTPFKPLDPVGPKCTTTKECPNPKCQECVKTKPYGDKCAELFPKEHVVGECKPKPEPESPCDICKNEITIITGQDKVCGHNKYKCETKPVGPCEYCEKELKLPVDKCAGKKKGDTVTLCERKDPQPTPAPCKPKECDFCREKSKSLPVDTSKRCPTCPEEVCVPLEAKPTQKPTAPERCCTGEMPAGKLEKVNDHPKCNETVCVLDCSIRDAALQCDPCTEELVSNGKKDDCGCEIKKCEKLPPKSDEKECDFCKKMVAVPMNPNNKECKKMVKKCVEKSAVYQIVEKPEDIIPPEDDEDPEDEFLDKKQKLFKLADDKIIEEMAPEEFLEELSKLPEDEPALLQGGKVVVKTKPKEETPEGETPAEYVIKPETEAKEPKLKVFVFTPDTCPAIPEPTDCALKGKAPKLCKCKVHQVTFPVEECKPDECPSECVDIKKPPAEMLPTKDGKCQAIKKHCANATCSKKGMKKCTDDLLSGVTTETRDCEPAEEGEKSCTEQTVRITYKKVRVPDGKKDTFCCDEQIEVGECTPKKCKEVQCNDVCEERRVVKESDACGCAIHVCVPKEGCTDECSDCEVCSKVEDAKEKCTTWKCVPKPAPKIERCEKAETTIEDGVIVTKVDECGHVKIVPDCPAKISNPHGCDKGHCPSVVKDNCNCTICDPVCCAPCEEIVPPTPKDCPPCHKKVKKTACDGHCPYWECVPEKCTPPKAVNCPTCEKLENEVDQCGCVTAKCVIKPCKKITKPLVCKKGEKLEVKKDECGCVVQICKAAKCQEECSAGEVCKKKVCLCEEIMTKCRQQSSKAMEMSKFLPNVHVPDCDKTGAFVAKQCHNGVCFCVDVETGVKKIGTEGAADMALEQCLADGAAP